MTRLHMQTVLEIRVKETLQNGKSTGRAFHLSTPVLKFDFSMFELKALIELGFTVFQKSSQIKRMLKNFELYKNRPLGIIRLAKFAREKYQ